MNKLIIDPTKTFHRINKAFKDGKRVIINVGGTGSGKTYATLQYIILLALNKKRDIIIARESMPVLRDSAMKDFFQILVDMEYYSTRLHNKTSNKYIFPNGSEVKFLGLDDPNKLKGVKSDIIFIDEANNVTLQHYNALNMRCNEVAFLGYNPSSVECWIDKVAELDESILFKSTYLDNKFIPDERRKTIENLRLTDRNAWLVYAKGEKPIPESIIYSHFKKYNTLPSEVPDNITYGLDFGYTHPTAMVKVYHYGNRKYIEQILYKSKLDPNDIILEIGNLGIGSKEPIYCDYSRPEIIALLKKNRYNALNADKEVKAGITSVKLCEIYVHVDSTELWNEVNNYSWKDGKMDEPIKLYDDLLDATRYSIHNVGQAFNINRFKVRVG